jgi:hypothetical protein
MGVNFLIFALHGLHSEVCGPNCGNETEMVKLDYKAENDTSL